jgi:hypothetical protein
VITIGQHQLEDGTAISISNETPVAGGAAAAGTQAAEAGASEAKIEAKS